MRSAGSAPASSSVRWSESADRRRIGRSDRQLPYSVLLHLGDDERFVAPPRGRGRTSILSSLIAVASTPVLLALFFVLMMAQFGVRTVQPIATLYVQELVGPRPRCSWARVG
jgi:hypothetical protein